MTRQLRMIVVAALALIPLLILMPSLVGATPVYTAVEFFPDDAGAAKVRLDVQYAPSSGDAWIYNFTFTNLPGSGLNALGLISIDFGQYEDGTKADAPYAHWASVAGGTLMNMGDSVWVLLSPALNPGEVLPTIVFETSEYVASFDVLFTGRIDTQKVELPRSDGDQIPEPGSLLLIGSAILLLAGIFRKMPYKTIR